uniref:Phospholipase A(2) n=1 Tax=Romanomermis culicivorax TaxID=13658 RepID=A0A915ILD8_ROMCU
MDRPFSSIGSADRLVSKHVLATQQKIYAIVHEVHASYQQNAQKFTSTDGQTLITTIYQGYGNLLHCNISHDISQIKKFKSSVKKRLRLAENEARANSRHLLTQPIYRSNLGLMVNMKEQYQKCRRLKKMMNRQHAVQNFHKEAYESVRLTNRQAAFIMHERWCDGHVPGTKLISAPVHDCCRGLRRCVRENGKDNKEDRKKCKIFVVDYSPLLNCECNRKFSNCLTTIGTKEALKTRNIFLAYAKGDL